MSGTLSGRQILLTRPEGQVEPLAARLREQGAQVSHFPAIQITLIPPDSTAQALVEQATFVIFVSTNAVRGLVASPNQLVQTVRNTSMIAAIGPATEAALKQAGLKPGATAPPPHNSEALLSNPFLRDLKHHRAIIVRGQSGREKLAKELRNRGAEVHYLEVYRRDPPDRTLSFKETSGRFPDVICVTSAEIATNLRECIVPEEKNDLLGCVLIAGNARIATACRNLGYTALHGVADNPGDDAMLEALNAYFSPKPPIS